ncbi:MAG TPA: copper homeostasis protein CutC [Terracidiphilus sp.]|nr:copper homeostasis protein CutC [Terracidiphilus sp.]
MHASAPALRRGGIRWDCKVMVVEICVDSLEAAITAAKGGAERIELCSDLTEGGITPSAGLLHMVRAAVPIDVFVMIRPRGGDSCYSARELETMEADIAVAKRLGANGVVFGVLQSDGHVDVARTERFVKLAAPVEVTFHRAIDMTPDLERACEDAITAGAHRILTSGGKQTARLGAEQIARLVKRADGRLGVMAASGINANNAAELIRATGVRELHASLRRRTASPLQYRNGGVSMGARRDSEFVRYELMEDDVRALRRAADAAAAANGERSIK